MQIDAQADRYTYRIQYFSFVTVICICNKNPRGVQYKGRVPDQELGSEEV